jgi:outer membrane protein OmpA-like peptidoglycan-associated protein
MVIVGYADPSEGNLDAKKIATSRAEYVKTLVVRAAFPVSRIFAEGRAATDRTKVSTEIAPNRRVELEILYFPPGSCGSIIPLDRPSPSVGRDHQR